MIQVEKIISESLNENEEHLARIKRQMAVLQANPTDRALLSSQIEPFISSKNPADFSAWSM